MKTRSFDWVVGLSGRQGGLVVEFGLQFRDLIINGGSVKCVVKKVREWGAGEREREKDSERERARNMYMYLPLSSTQ